MSKSLHAKIKEIVASAKTHHGRQKWIRPSDITSGLDCILQLAYDPSEDVAEIRLNYAGPKESTDLIYRSVRGREEFNYAPHIIRSFVGYMSLVGLPPSKAKKTSLK